MLAGRPVKYEIVLTPEEDALCKETVSSKTVCKTVKIRSLALRALNNCQHHKLTRKQIAQSFCTNQNYPSAVAKRFCKDGINGVLTIIRNPNSDSAQLRLGTREEGILVSLACTPPPSPHPRWTVARCTEALNRTTQEMGLETGFSQSTVWRALKRNKLRPHLSQYWCIPEITPNFILRMEKVLHIYSLPYDSDYPVVCMDELALQLIRDMRDRLSLEPASIEKLDYEYVRMGTTNIFVFVEPKTGQYYVRSTENRTAVDWAFEIRNMVDGLYPNAKKVILITDNLNIHSTESLYKAFSPEEAKRIADRIEIIYTPVHASWLNMAEIAINVTKVECIGKRFRTEEEVNTLPSRLDEWQEKKTPKKKLIHGSSQLKRLVNTPICTKWNTTLQRHRYKSMPPKTLYVLSIPVKEMGDRWLLTTP